MNSKILELLYRSFDRELNPNEQHQLEQALAGSKELREEKERIANMRTMISDSSEEKFHPFFAEKVMRRIREEQTQENFLDSLVHVFRPVAIAATVVLIALMSYNVLKSNEVSVASAFAQPEITLEQALDPTLSLALE